MRTWNGTMNHTDDALLDERATARALTEEGYQTSPATLATKRSRGGGPQFRYFGRRVLCRWGDVLAWARSRLSEPARNTSEAASLQTPRRAAPEVATATARPEATPRAWLKRSVSPAS